MSDRFLSIAQIRHIEADAIAAKYNLMDIAGTKIASWVRNNIANEKKILILVGRGNNGGDGVLAGIKLLQLGYAVAIFAVATQINPTTEALISQFTSAHGTLLNRFPIKLDGFNIIIDAMLGIGIKRKIDEKLSQLIDSVNQSGVFVLAVDTPTGLDPFSGEVFGNAIEADHTITFISDKPGFYTGNGADLVGKVSFESLVDLNSFKLVRSLTVRVLPNELSNINYSCLARKTHNTNKGTFGTVAIVGGNAGMHGALYLAGRAAMLMGSGKVILASFDDNFATDYLMPELMQAKPRDILRRINEFSAVVIGPGFGQDDRALKFLTKLLKLQVQTKFIFDADALNLIAGNPALHDDFKALPNKIITPHPGEAARLLKSSVVIIGHNRFKAVSSLKLEFNAVSLLKGVGSLIEDNEAIYLNQTGNSALSNAGQGDTLCGIIAAFLAQGMSMSEALKLGVFLHGKAAETLAVSIGYNGVLATEIALTARNLLNQLLYA